MVSGWDFPNKTYPLSTWKIVAGIRHHRPGAVGILGTAQGVQHHETNGDEEREDQDATEVQDGILDHIYHIDITLHQDFLEKPGKVGNEANQLVIEIIDYVDICVDIWS